MQHINTEEFDKLIAEKRFDEAKEMLRKFFEAEIGGNDEGEYYVELMTEYLEMSNRINSAYIAEMQEIKQQLKDLDEIERAGKSKIDADQIRRDIENL